MRFRAARLAAIAAPLLSAALLGVACGADEPDGGAPAAAGEACAEEREVGEACAGLSASAACAGEACAEGLACSSVTRAGDQASLEAALGAAGAGDCVVLSSGEYGDASLPKGVSLLGEDTRAVFLRSVRASGSGLLRGVTAREGVSVLPAEGGAAGEFAIESSVVLNPSGSGVDVGAGASARVSESEIRGAAAYGVRAFDAAAVRIERSIVEEGQGPGLWFQCGSGCDCPGELSASVSDSIVARNRTVGVSLVGVNATLTNVRVSDHLESHVAFGSAGGVSVTGCSIATAEDVEVSNSSSFGVLVDAASADFRGLSVEKSAPGVWVQKLAGDGSQAAKFSACELHDNAIAGFGVSNDSHGVLLEKSVVSGTRLVTVPVAGGGQKDVGDGVTWLDRSSVVVRDVTLRDNARLGILIDGAMPATSLLERIRLEGKDAESGIVQQGVEGPGEGAVPVGPETPSPTFSADKPFAVPVGPETPPAQ